MGPNTPAVLDLGHTQQALSSQDQWHQHVCDITLTALSSHSLEINLHNKVRLLRSTVPRDGILSNSCHFFLHVIMEECIREWSLGPEVLRKLRKVSTQWKKI